jgi:hypothetical protein
MKKSVLRDLILGGRFHVPQQRQVAVGEPHVSPAPSLWLTIRSGRPPAQDGRRWRGR